MTPDAIAKDNTFWDNAFLPTCPNNISVPACPDTNVAHSPPSKYIPTVVAVSTIFASELSLVIAEYLLNSLKYPSQSNNSSVALIFASPAIISSLSCAVPFSANPSLSSTHA